MSVYLKEFENHTQYENYINGSDAILPNVSICTTEGDVHYNPSSLVPPTPVETRVVTKYNVISTSSPTEIGYDDYISGFSEIEIDGVVQPSVTTRYTFSTTGEHTVKYTLTDPTSICKNAFNDCYRLTSITIPNSVTSIGEGAFNSCNSLTSVTIPNGVTSIGDYAFYACSRLTSVVISDSVTTIGNGAFHECYDLTSCTIGSGVTSISIALFTNCESLTSITIPNSVTSIGEGAFEGTGLTSITIPDSVTTIDNYAFCGCPLDTESVNEISAINPRALDC